MQDGQCHTGDMDTNAAIKVRKEPQGEAGGWPGSESQGYIASASDESENFSRGDNRLTLRRQRSRDIRAGDRARQRN